MIDGLRLFAIETRRSIGLWAFPVLAGLAWLAWYIRGLDAMEPVTLWPGTSVGIGFAVALVGPAAGGLAAWVAGRDRRRGMDDLLATTPRPATARELSLLAATGFWVMLAYGATGACLALLVAREATWGGPVAEPILIGGLGISASTAIGYAIGSFAGGALSSRLLAALVPVGLFFAQMLPTLLQGDIQAVGPRTETETYPYENLSPFALVQEIGGSVFWSPRSEIAWWAVVWLLGLSGLAAAIVALRRTRRPGAWVTLVASVVAVAVGWSQLVPAPVWAVPAPTRAIAYEPVCTQRSIPVCVHPAYEAVLDETADLVDPIVRPLVGVPGFPTRVVQLPPALDGIAANAWAPWAPDSMTADTLPISLDCADFPRQTRASGVAVAAVRRPSPDAFGLTPAQGAIALWLLRQAGWEEETTITVASCVPLGNRISTFGLDESTLQAADRFAALSPEAQRAWLKANLAALRAGELDLEDLP
jgi:hypothetical protein